MMKNFTLSTVFVAVFALLAASVTGQTSFTNRNDLLPTTDIHSGVPMAVVDMNGDRLDDIVRLDNRRVLVIEYQNADGTFTELNWGQISNSSAWAMCVADIDRNGYNDIMAGGAYNDVEILMANGTGTDYTQQTITQPSIFVQGSNFADVNGDGWLDLFSCHDDGTSQIWGNDGAGNLVPQSSWIDLSTVPSSGNGGNYGSTWTDFDNDGDLDLYIAKCRQGVTDPNDPERINMLFLNDGNNNYIQDTNNDANLRIGWQSWTADFQDIDNDGDFDVFVTNHDHESQIMENNGDGTFTDITASTGIVVNGLPIQGLLRDFDNDGWVDLIVSGNDQAFYHNNGDKTFTSIDIFNSDDMESIAIGDLNHDGFLDVYAGYAVPFNTPTNIDDVVWMNDGNDNNWFAITLEGVTSNINAIGARVQIYGDWGVQVREVRSGESYGIMNTFANHFGIGTSTAIDSVVVDWPAGGHEVLTGLGPNQFVHLIEGSCTPPNASVTADGPLQFCSGDDVMFTAPAGGTYLWSTGATTQSISTGTSGSYWVNVSNGTGCESTSGVLTTSLDPVEAPEIQVTGETTFCAGGTTTLTVTSALGYTWSNGATTQSIDVTASGSYFVQTQGACSTGQTDTIEIDVLATPTAPTATGETVVFGNTATLTTTAANAAWFDASTGGNQVGTGSPWETAAMTANTTFYAEDQLVYNATSGYAARTDNSGGGGENTANNPGWLLFDVWEALTIKSVKVYAFGEANRTVQLRDHNDNVIEEVTINMVDGEARYDLNFDVPVGSGWQLTCASDPSLYRNNSLNNEYPFDLLGAGEITESNFGTQYYYSFYEWDIETSGKVCGSPRAAADVVVTPPIGIDELAASTSVNVFPNPTSGLVNVSFRVGENTSFDIRVMDAMGKIVAADKYNAAAGQSTHQLELSGFAPGFYIVELVSNNQRLQERVMVK